MNYLTTSQAAALAAVNDETIRRWCDLCNLKHTKIGRMYAITEEDLRWFMEHGDRRGYGKEVNPSPVRKQAKEIQKKLKILRNRQRLDEIIKLQKQPIYLERGER